MNIYELDRLIERVKEDKELFNFYTKKRKELVNQINKNVKEALSSL